MLFYQRQDTVKGTGYFALDREEEDEDEGEVEREEEEEEGAAPIRDVTMKGN